MCVLTNHFLFRLHVPICLPGNPIYDGLAPEQQRVEVLKRLPQLTKIDGVMVTPGERTAAGGE